jgi:hypothetical protein
VETPGCVDGAKNDGAAAGGAASGAVIAGAVGVAALAEAGDATPETAKSSATDSAGPISMTLEHTEHRARTPGPGTFEGSIRKTVRQLVHVMFTTCLPRAS